MYRDHVGFRMEKLRSAYSFWHVVRGFSRHLGLCLNQEFYAVVEHVGFNIYKRRLISYYSP